ncbi:MAG TPA: SDR family NAD(P)-dependent oxidoreductase, partial [Pyrinomonadaceae bacterium]|nr:SDR family NAD(P)-dependent oxidoreductase [Pyrinomonadaceae bacterium]
TLASKPSGHPLLGRRIRSAVTLYESELGGDAPAWLREHRVFDAVITPAAATLEMVLAAATAHFKTSAVTIEDVAIRRALTVPPDGRRVAQLILDPAEGERAAFRILALDESGGEEEWELHMTGSVAANRRSPPGPSQNGHVPQKPSGAAPGEEWYRQCREWGADFGAAFFSLEWLQRGTDVTQSSVAVPEHLRDDEGYCFHPILLDGALQTAVASLPEGGVHLPISFERLEIRSTQSRRALCRVRRREHTDPATRQVDVELLDDRGELLARVVGLTLRRASREAISATAPAARDLYQVVWKPAESAPTAAAAQARRYLVVSDCREAAEGVAERLRHLGASCTVGLHAATFEHPGADEFNVNLDRPDDIRRMLDAVVARGERLEAVLVLSLSAADADTTPELAERDCGRLLNFVQAAAQLEVVNGPSFCVVTRGAQPAGDAAEQVDPAKSALWGMASVISLEHSEWRTLLVDLGLDSWSQDLDFVVDEVMARSGASADEGEDRVAYRAGRRHLARLTPGAAAPRAEQLTIRGDASYLITGGLGGVGLKLARWLAEQGAGAIVLAGRNAVRNTAEPELEKLRQSGARVIVEQLDVTDDAAVASLVARVNSEVAPLKGVIHAAGLLDDAIIMRQRPEQFLGVLRPKTRGAWNLHVRTRELALDFFVLCSSMASVTGSPGQSNYTAANAFLDGLAWYRRRLGLP